MPVMTALRAIRIAMVLWSFGPAAVEAQLQTARVAGAVVTAQGRPVAGAVVVLTDPLGAVLQTRTTDAAGRFAFAEVPPGRFSLRAQPAGDAPSAYVPLLVEAALPVDVTLRLPPALSEAIRVEGQLDAPSTRMAIAGSSLAAVPGRMRGRSVQNAVATLPGWATEDNGLLHARGVDDGFLYVIDGVPVYERLDTLTGMGPETSALGSINVVTGYVAPEFGYKAGGVIELQSAAVADQWDATGDLGGGSFGTIDGGLVAGGAIGRALRGRAGASAQRSARFLDPVHPDNLHNDGASRTFFGALETRRGRRDHVRAGWSVGRSHFDVPNTAEQDQAGQDQRQRITQDSLNLSWQRVWSARVVTHAAAYHRRGHAVLDPAAMATPISATSDRSLIRTGVLTGVSLQRGAHLFKAGVEGQQLALDEVFGFFVTDQDEGEEAGLSAAALAYDADEPFAFAGAASPHLWSFYLQDSWQAGARLTIAAGVRADRTRVLLPRHQFSPRAGVSYRLGDATVLRGSVSRFFQPPQPEHLLLASSPEARALSPFTAGPEAGGAAVEPERQWALEAGAEHRFRHWRLDGAAWRRDAREVADPNVFFGTTVVFPNAVARGRAHGVDVRVEVPRWRGWSGYASGTVSRVVQTGPVTGGLFLEDEVADFGPGVEFVPDHDQRVALAGGASWEHPGSGFTASAAVRYESGTPISRDDDDADELRERAGAELVDFDCGRVAPRALASLSAAVPMLKAARAHVVLRVSVLNLLARRYAYNFGNPFSGTHFGAGRSASVALQISTRPVTR